MMTYFSNSNIGECYIYRGYWDGVTSPLRGDGFEVTKDGDLIPVGEVDFSPFEGDWHGYWDEAIGAAWEYWEVEA